MADVKDMAHMKRDPEVMGDMNAGSEDYPYGMCISLTEEDMKKVGLEMPKIGEMVHIMAMTKVTSTHAHSSEGGDSAGCCLQITHMKAEVEDTEDDEPPEDTRTPAQKIYGKK